MHIWCPPDRCSGGEGWPRRCLEPADRLWCLGTSILQLPTGGQVWGHARNPCRILYACKLLIEACSLFLLVFYTLIRIEACPRRGSFFAYSPFWGALMNVTCGPPQGCSFVLVVSWGTLYLH